MSKSLDADAALANFYDEVLLGNKHGKKGKDISGAHNQNKAMAARAKLSAIAKGAPEVMIKVSGKGTGMAHVKSHIDYISRDGELPLEDEDGNIVSGKDAAGDVVKEWQQSGRFIPDHSDRKESYNMVFSMPPGTSPRAVKAAVTDLAKKQFGGNNQYLMALHTYETDPDPKPSKHPHVHLVVLRRGRDGKLLQLRKADLHALREGFAQELGRYGVEAIATKRQQRLKREKGLHQAVAHIIERGEVPKSQGRVSSDERVTQAQRTEEKVRAGYTKLFSALKVSTEADKRLAASLESQLFGKSRPMETGRDSAKDSDIER